MSILKPPRSTTYSLPSTDYRLFLPFTSYLSETTTYTFITNYLPSKEYHLLLSPTLYPSYITANSSHLLLTLHRVVPPALLCFSCIGSAFTLVKYFLFTLTAWKSIFQTVYFINLSSSFFGRFKMPQKLVLFVDYLHIVPLPLQRYGARQFVNIRLSSTKRHGSFPIVWRWFLAVVWTGSVMWLGNRRSTALLTGLAASGKPCSRLLGTSADGQS